MQLHELKRNTPNRKARRVGRGGKRGKTAGRGTKGQKARAGRKLRPETRDIISKLPKRRGHGVNRARTVNSSVLKPEVVNVSLLGSIFDDKAVIDVDALFDKGLVRRKKGRLPEVKVLGKGNLDKQFSLKGMTVSASAKEKIERAGGTITESK